MRDFQDAAWVLLGVLLGTGTCFVLLDQPLPNVTGSVVQLASMSIFAMLASTLHGGRKPSRARN